METVVWQWGPFSIAVFSLTFFAAVLIGVVMVITEGRRKLLPEQRVTDFIILALVSGILGGRLSYALLFNAAYYLENPVHLFRLQDGGLSFWGGLGTALIVVSVWAIRKKIIVERYLDAAAPALAAALALGYSGAALQGQAMSSPYPWGIPYAESIYHPDGVYTALLLVLLLSIIRGRRSRSAYEGELFIWFVFGYGLINLSVDFFRAAAPRIWILSTGQAVSLAAVLLALFYILGGSKIYTAASYSDRKLNLQKNRLPRLLNWCGYLVYGAALTAIYYWVHGVIRIYF